jgi:hypothetical protein
MQIDSTANRKKTPPIKVCCTPDERQKIIGKAEQCGLSASRYLRAIGLGMGIKPLIDYRAIEDLMKVNGDLGRLGGLLKLWLTNDEKLRLENKIVLRNKILAALMEIESSQSAVRDVLQQVLLK